MSMDDFIIDDKLFFKEHVKAYRIFRAIDTANLFMKVMGGIMMQDMDAEILSAVGKSIGGEP